LHIIGTIPIIDLFVVSIESIQQQGIILTPEIEAIIPLLKDKVKELMYELLVTEKVVN
jgi:hydrogenase maturation protease